MGFVNADGKNISYECSKLIKKLKGDILEFGEDKVVNVLCKDYEGVILYINYDFIENEKDKNLKKNELKEGEFFKQIKMSELLSILEKQNNIL